MKLYIDFVRVIPTRAIQKFHGGGNYARVTLRNLLLKDIEDIEIVLLYPSFYEVNKDTEPEFYNHPKITWEPVDKISADYEYEYNSTLYYTILFEYSDFKEIKKIHIKRPDIKIVATVHDVRMFDITLDYTEKYYLSGWKKAIFPVFKFATEICQPYLYRHIIKQVLGYLDKVFTVSNYSMQSILKLNKNANVCLYYCTTFFDNDLETVPNTSNYILFVSGSRRLKNFSHALIGFCRYRERYPESEMQLVVTGIDDKKFKNICKIPSLNQEIIKSSVKNYDYVDYETLKKLYQKCKFVLYTSKAEGFGIPVLEAANYGKTCVASNVTSIPEVLAQAVRYVPPMNDLAIADEIAYLADDVNRVKYEKRIARALEYTLQRMRVEQDNFYEDLFEIVKGTFSKY